MRRKGPGYFGCALLAGGALAFGWYAYLRMDMLRAQRVAGEWLDEQRTRPLREKPTFPVPHFTVVVRPHTGDAIGRIELPRLHLSVMVLEGDSSKVLRVAAGHITGTAGSFRYAVDGIEIVNPDQTRVIRATSDCELTLVTCYPFTYIGTAPKRFIVHARQQR